MAPDKESQEIDSEPENDNANQMQNEVPESQIQGEQAAAPVVELVGQEDDNGYGGIEEEMVTETAEDQYTYDEEDYYRASFQNQTHSSGGVPAGVDVYTNGDLMN